MNQLSNPRMRTANLTVQPVGEETLLYDERSHTAFCLNRVAGAVWHLCDGSRGVPSIVAEAGLALGLPLTEDAVRLALSELGRDGLLMVEDEAFATVHHLSRRALMARMGAGAALMLPVIAMAVAPKAAQAYSGCVNCSSAQRRHSPTE